MTWHRRPVLLGHVGIVWTTRAWVPASAPDPEARVWALAQPGVRVERGPIGFVVHFPAARPIDGRTGVLPLVAIRDRWCSAPLDPRDVVAHPAGAVLTLHGFRIRSTADLEPVDLAQWLDLSGWQLEAVAPLGPPPPPPVLVAPPIDRAAHVALGVEAPDGGSGTLIRALRAGSTAGGRVAQLQRAVGAALFSGMAGVARWFSRGSSRSTSAGEERAGGSSGVPTGPQRGLLPWLESMAGRLGLASALGRAVGEQHLRYLQRMMGLFESGRWEDAIKHAIPLSGGGGELGAGGWLSWLAPRGGLGLSGAGGSRSAVGLGTDLFDLLKTMYRRAFRAFDSAHKVHEAAYVLAELLDEAEEAVTYLEKHGRLALAAEFAERKELEPSRVVQLWFQAGNIERAVVLARRHHAFAGAVQHLERTGHDELALGLRTIWAVQEAEAGHYGSAAGVAWPVPALRDQAKQWLTLGMSTPGVVGARSLRRFARVCPDDRDTAHEALQALIDAGPDGTPARQLLAEGLAREPDEATNWMATPLARALLRDLRRQPSPERKRAVRDLVAKAADGLGADLPGLPASGWPALVRLVHQEARDYVLNAADVGTTRVHDVVGLPGGRFLLALGELGLRITTRTGRVLRRFDTPAHHLVGNLGESHLVLAVTRRGSLLRVARLEVAPSRLRPWIELEAHTFAPMFDGHTWFVADDQRVWGLDAHATEPKTTWTVPDIDAGAIAVTPEELQIQVLDGEIFRYRIPALSLLGRVAPDAKMLHADARLRLHTAAARFPTFPFSDVGEVAFGRELSALVHAGEPDPLVTIRRGLDRSTVLRGTVHHLGATHVGVRWLEDDLATFDDLGRVRVIDARSGDVSADLRA